LEINLPCILVVDDDSQFRRTLCLALSSHGYEVRVAVDGKAALDSVAARVPDLVVLDWQLPRMNGIEMCRMLRKSSDVPVIMVSGNRSTSKGAAMDAGANDYLAKPFSINDLLTRIEAALKPGLA
jgi:DNA-binding response OmpR family regulator